MNKPSILAIPAELLNLSATDECIKFISISENIPSLLQLKLHFFLLHNERKKKGFFAEIN